ncbi:MAG: 3-methyl-2-oxobutanoate dehydrogenase subunit VorB, partial [Bacteroidales bacterium]|nr:3-methyl-2-oxobutanoate dehydrogenase subunit VorB [Bacteroidales bacterium]
MAENILIKGNEALAYGAIRCGCDGYFGYPITPQSEVMETLMKEQPWESTGMVVLQAESEVAAINMLYGGAATGKMVMTSSSSPGISLMCEGISYMAGAELPCVIVDVMRGGPGLGTIQPSQSDYFQCVKGGGHGDYKVIVLAPASVQDMYDFIGSAFKLAFKYRTPAIILTDGVIGQMMEKLEFRAPIARRTPEEIKKQCGEWALLGKTPDRKKHVATSLSLEAPVQEAFNLKLQAKYREIEKTEQLYAEYKTDDAEYLIVAYGSMSRLSESAVDIAREKGYKVGLLRPITLFPYPT